MPSVQASNLVNRFKKAYSPSVTIPRPAYLPPQVRGTDPMVPEGTDLAIWLWEENGKPYGIAFQAKSNKPLWHFSFRNEAERDRRVQQTIDSRKLTLKRKEDELKERREFRHPYKEGDILYTSWGYDETHIDFYQVTGLRGKMVLVRPIASKSVKEEKGVDYVSAAKDHFTGPAVKVLPTPNGVKIDGHSASIWDGKPKYETAMGWGH